MPFPRLPGTDPHCMELDQIVFLVILASALALFVSGRMRVDLVAMLTLLALALTGILDARQALAGFSSEPAIIVAAVFVLSAGLQSTGITDRIGAWIGRTAGGSVAVAARNASPHDESVCITCSPARASLS